MYHEKGTWCIGRASHAGVPCSNPADPTWVFHRNIPAECAVMYSSQCVVLFYLPTACLRFERCRLIPLPPPRLSVIIRERHHHSHTPPSKQNIYITFVQRRSNGFAVGPTLYKCYTNVSCLLGRWFLCWSTNWPMNFKPFSLGPSSDVTI